MVDAHLRSKTIETTDIKNLIIGGQTGIDGIRFCLAAVTNGENLADPAFSWFLQYKNKNGQGESVGLTPVYENGLVKLPWVPNKLATQVPGRMQIQLYAAIITGEGEAAVIDKQWVSEPGVIYIQENLNPDPIIATELTIFDQYLTMYQSYRDASVAALQGISDIVSGEDFQTVLSLNNSIPAVAAMDESIPVVAGMAVSVPLVAGVKNEIPVLAPVVSQIEQLALIKDQIVSLEAEKLKVAAVEAKLAEIQAVHDKLTEIEGVYGKSTEIDALYSQLDTIEQKVNTSDIVNDITTGGTNVPISAEQVKVLAAESLLFRSDITTGSIDALYDVGIYTINASVIGQVTTLPSYYSAIGNIFLSLEVIKMSSRFIRQRLWDSTRGVVFCRRLDKDNGTADGWFRDSLTGTEIKALLSSKPLESSELSGNCLARGTCIDIDLAYDEGSYLVTSSTTGTKPDKFSTNSGILIVSSASNRWVTQVLRYLSYTDLAINSTMYFRVIDKNTSSRSLWRVLGDTRPLLRKKVLCLGDSITQNSYPSILATISGAVVVDGGFGGTRMSEHSSVSYDAFSMYHLADSIVSSDYSLQEAQLAARPEFTDTLNRIKAVDFSTLEYLTIFFGANDYASDVPIDDVDIVATNAYISACRYSVDKILTAYPSLKIVLITPTWRARISSGDGKDADNYPNNLGKYLSEYVDALIAMGKAFKIPVLDMFYTNCVNKYTHSIYLVDGLHPTTAGETLYANRIRKFLEGY